MTVHHVLDYSLFGNTLDHYAASAGIFAGLLLAILLVRRVVLVRLKSAARKTETLLDDTLVTGFEKNALPLLAFMALYIAVQDLMLSPQLSRTLHIIVAVVVAFFGIRYLLSLVTFGIEQRWRRDGLSNSQRQSVRVMQTMFQIVAWTLGGVILLDNLGVKISTLAAGLGIGGIAVALAAQAVLGDLFAYFVIIFDRPFETGDFITVNEFSGSVDHIGVKSTRLRGLGGEMLIFHNTDLTNSRISNYRKMVERRILFSFGVEYGTPIELLQTIPQLVATIVRAIPDARFDRAHFKEFADSSLKFEAVYFVLTADYNRYMDIQQEINFALMRELDKLGIRFAFPTQTVVVKNSDEL